MLRKLQRLAVGSSRISLLLSHPETVEDDPHVASDSASTRIDNFDREWVEWMVTGNDPPDDFAVYLMRRSMTGELPWANERQVLSLPGRLDVDGRELRFISRSVGIRGLDATFVWHPGWPIQHPLVDEGRAAVLWPNPAAVNLGTMPEVHPGEFGLEVDGSFLSYSSAHYARVTEVPLQVGLLPLEIAFTQLSAEVTSDEPVEKPKPAG